jgi:hypothetical protein
MDASGALVPSPRSRPFRPHPASTPLAHLYQGLQLKRHIDLTLGQGNILEAVRLPPGEDLREWLAVNTVSRDPTKRAPRSPLHNTCAARPPPLGPGRCPPTASPY